MQSHKTLQKKEGVDSTLANLINVTHTTYDGKC